MQENHLSPSERADVIRNINMKQQMLFGIPITEEMYDEVIHDATDSALLGISLALSLLIMKKRRECWRTLFFSLTKTLMKQIHIMYYMNEILHLDGDDCITINAQLLERLLLSAPILDPEDATRKLKERLEWVLDAPKDVSPNPRAYILYDEIVRDAFLDLQLRKLQIRLFDERGWDLAK